MVAGALTFFGFLLTTIVFGFREIRKRKQRTRSSWDRAQIDFIRTMLFSLFLMLVSGIGAHNLARANWFWWSGLMIVACTCLPDPEDDEDEPEADRKAA